MNIEDVDEVQAQILLDLWECCGEEVGTAEFASAYEKIGFPTEKGVQ